jgi:hypothetical protein
MKLWTILLLILLGWLACLVYEPHRVAPDTSWLSGAWHDPIDDSRRMFWGSPGPHGLSGVLLSGTTAEVMTIERRKCGCSLLICQPPGAPRKVLGLLEHGPNFLRFQDDLTLQYSSFRTRPGELRLEVGGQTRRFVRD